MANENLKIDVNNKFTAGAVTDDAAQEIRNLRIDDTTKGLKVMLVGGVGTGTITSISQSTGILLTPNPIISTGTIGLSTALSPMASLTGNSLKFLRVNAGETALEYSSSVAGGTVTSVSVVSANGISGSVSTATTTPTITLSLSGTNQQVVFNDAGSFGGDTGMVYNKTSNQLTVGNILINDATDSVPDISTPNGAAPLTISFGGGTATSGNGNGGDTTIYAGAGNGSGTGGDIGSISGNGGATGRGGATTLVSGDGGLTSGTGGYFGIFAGTGVGGNSAGGALDIYAGNAHGTQAGGDLTLAAGAGGATAGQGGDIFLVPGLNGAGGTNGFVKIGNQAKVAILNADSIASTDKTFTFPNLTGTFALTGASQTVSFGATTVGGTLALGANNLTTTGTLAATGARVTKGWFTDVESTNMPTVGGTAILTSLTAPQFTTIELGAASDTTIARSGAGAITVEGVQVILSGAALGTPASGTLTNCTGLPAASVVAGTFGTGSYTMDTQLTVKQIVNTSNAITASANAATVPITSRISTVTNNSAATLTITITTTSAVDGQMVMVRILDFSAATQTITWVNTENSTVTAPTTSNGSTTLPLTVGFQYNNATSKWRCIASA